jgi:adenosylcobinamide-GDP ribazoletransferase
MGTNGLLAVVSVLLLNIALLASMAAMENRYFLRVLLLFPVAGRIGSLVSASVSVYARTGEGLGKSFIDFCGKKELITGLIIYFAIFYAIGGAAGVLAAVVPTVAAFASAKLLGRRIGGATGDILGAVCEINQTVFLTEMLLILRHSLY